MITFLTPYYKNGGMLREQLAGLSLLDIRVLKRLEYIVVDDGSPSNTAAQFLRFGTDNECNVDNIDFSLYEIEVDLPWNHIAARNIAVNHAKYDWLFMTDIDHRVPEKTWQYLLKVIMRNELDRSKVYTFDRVDAPYMTPYKPHPHTWFMHRSVWDKFGGYDERFSGHYGMDFLARERLLAFTSMEKLPVPVIRYPREVIPDASTVDYERKLPADRAAVKDIRRKLKAEGSYEKPHTLTFPYRKVFPT